MAFCEIKNLIPMKEPADKTRMFWTLLKGQALSYFEHHLMRRLEIEDSDVPDNELIELVLRNVGLEYILKRSHKLLSLSSHHILSKILPSISSYLHDLDDNMHPQMFLAPSNNQLNSMQCQPFQVQVPFLNQNFR
jgi:hypothetical protein